MRVIRTWVLAAAVVVPSCARQRAGPPWPGDTWPASAPEEQGMDSAALKALDSGFASGRHGYIDGMLMRLERDADPPLRLDRRVTEAVGNSGRDGGVRRALRLPVVADTVRKPESARRHLLGVRRAIPLRRARVRPGGGLQRLEHLRPAGARTKIFARPRAGSDPPRRHPAGPGSLRSEEHTAELP